MQLQTKTVMFESFEAKQLMAVECYKHWTRIFIFRLDIHL